MAQILSDGTTMWLGGMDTSRSPADISEVQYSKGNNIIIPDSLGGVRARFGIHCNTLDFEDRDTRNIYMNNPILAEGYFVSNGISYLTCYVSGYLLLFKRVTANRFFVRNMNSGNRNIDTTSAGWIIQIPNGCILNNGFDFPLIVRKDSSIRSNPSKGGIGIGRMGVFVQHRLFYADQSGKRILASDFNQPTKFTMEGTGIVGFMCPDADETITAITKQKSVLGTVEGGNLIWSTNKDIYSTDVRGTRSDWANLGSRTGKTSETVPGISASSSYSFEAFNTNIYFRSSQLGMADIKQSEAQFAQLDAMNSQSVEAAYYFNNDTDWMLSRCYSRACNKRLFTTVAPERHESGHVFWNGILSFFPAATYSNRTSAPRRFESVFTGVRPWCMTSVKSSGRDQLFIHSHDKDGRNRLYHMDEDSNYDIDQFGTIVEIKGFIETRAYTHGNPLLLKSADSRFYKMNIIDRTVKIKLFSRPETSGEWTEMSDNQHLVCRMEVKDNVISPIPHKGQTRPFVNLPSEQFDCCYGMGDSFISIQYRVEFSGPLNLDSIITSASLKARDRTVDNFEQNCNIVSYSYRPDYDYFITPTI